MPLAIIAKEVESHLNHMADAQGHVMRMPPHPDAKSGETITAKTPEFGLSHQQCIAAPNCSISYMSGSRRVAAHA
jgi:hypothetical protein